MPDNAGALADVEDDLDLMWVLLCTFLVLSMQLGFAMLEVGSCRMAHRMTVLTKNVLDSAVSSFAFWAYCHWGTPPDLITDDAGNTQHHLLLFHFAFCAASVTICSGAMSERTHMLAYIFYTLAMAGWVYPTAACAAWGGDSSLLYGEFHDRLHEGYHYHDLAGSGVVHLVGGCTAIVGNALVGRRIMRPSSSSVDSEESGIRNAAQRAHTPARDRARRAEALGPGRPVGSLACNCELERVPTQVPSESSHTSDEERGREALHWMMEPCHRPEGGWPRRFDSRERDREEFAPAHYLQAMGMFTLWVGWYGFNSGSILSMDGYGSRLASAVAWNSTLAASGGGLGSALYCYLFHQNLDVSYLCNGVISGLVAITAGADVASAPGAYVIGTVAGLIIYPGSNYLMQCIKMDDPPCAIAVHAACGLFGVLAVGFCRPDCADPAWAQQSSFCADDYNWRLQLLAQAWGAFTLIWWTVCNSLALWSIFAISEVARSLEAQELEELDAFLAARLDMEAERPSLPDGCLVKCSSAVRCMMKEHGWKEGDFRTPVDLSGLRAKLRRFREQSVDTALEVDHCLLLRGPAKLIRRTPVLRKLTCVRLRIAPYAELSGLGHANVNGGKLFKALQVAVSMQQENSKSTAQLERQVRELAEIVHSQDSMLQVASRPQLGKSHGPGSTSSWSKTTPSTASGRSGSVRGDETPLSMLGSEPSENLDDGALRDALEQAFRAQQGFLAALRVLGAPPSPVEAQLAPLPLRQAANI